MPPLIVLLGIDGAGKTTVAAALAGTVGPSGRRATVLRNRSGRRWLIRASHRIGRELPAGWADRVETVVRTVNVLASHVRAACTDGAVIMDRHVPCQLALRGVRGLPSGHILPWLSDVLLRRATVVLLDLPAEIARERVLARGEDDESLEFLTAMRVAYRGAARSQGWLVVDATGTIETITVRLLEAAYPEGVPTPDGAR